MPQITHRPLTKLRTFYRVNKVNLVQNFSYYVYFFCVYVSGEYVPMRGLQGAITPCIPDSHPYRITSTKCRKNTVFSPDDRRIVARNMQRKEINLLRKTVHEVGFIYKIRQGCIVNKTQKT